MSKQNTDIISELLSRRQKQIVKQELTKSVDEFLRSDVRDIAQQIMQDELVRLRPELQKIIQQDIEKKLPGIVKTITTTVTRKIKDQFNYW